MNEQPTPAARKISDAPFCWQHKAALRLIRESFDAEKAVASAIGVYVALTEIASDKESETFTTTHAWISLKSGWSPRTVQDRLPALEQIGLVKISTPPLKSPSTYLLLHVPQSLPNEPQPLPNAPQWAENASLPSSEEQEKKPIKNIKIIKRDLTKLTPSAPAMERIARDIAGNKRGWSYDNCKVQASDIKAASLETILLPYAGRLTEDQIHACWGEAAKRAHGATVDQLVNKTPAGYAVGCFKDLLGKAANGQ